jgi:DNA topoisomerase I
MDRTATIPATAEVQPIFDVDKARSTITKGRRAKWWRRMGSKRRGFWYVDGDGNRITDEDKLERIRSLVLPPAWKHVYVSPSPSSRLQAVGMDTRGRVQYRYHPKFAERQQKAKYSRIEEFGRYLPRLRQVTNQHIMMAGMPKEKVLAVMIRLINLLYFRVGTDQSEKHYRTYGITTLKNKHLTIKPNGELVFDFVGKSHVKHRKVLADADLAATMAEIKAIGRGKLFQYRDEEGRLRSVKPSDLNNYIKAATANCYSAKDFRTWGGTLAIAVRLAELGCSGDPKCIKKNIVRAVKDVAEMLGNTPSVCRSSYVHPTVLAAYENGLTLNEFRPRRQRRISRTQADYEPEEIALMRMFEAAA